jgi:(E)-4-hydroxy-3-methylbut-2-enyl-diphosphate synthase
VSLTAPPEREVKAGLAILKALGLRRSGADLISCPTCGRTKIDLIPIAEEAERRLERLNRPLTIAVMGCAVNGPARPDAPISVSPAATARVFCSRGVKLLEKYRWTGLWTRFSR